MCYYLCYIKFIIMTTYNDLVYKASGIYGSTNFTCPCCGKNLKGKDYNWLLKTKDGIFNVPGSEQNNEVPKGSQVVRVGAVCSQKYQNIK